MPSNIVSAVLITALLFTSLALAIDFAVESVKSIKMVIEAERAEGILQKFSELENGSFSFWGGGRVEIRERDVFMEYCGISEALKAYSICYTYNFSKCIEVAPEISMEKGGHGLILNLKEKRIIHSIYSEPGRHSIKIEKRLSWENKSAFELKNTTADARLNISAEISEKVRCGENLRLRINAGNSSEIRYISILEREKIEQAVDAGMEAIKASSRWFEEIGSNEGNFEYSIDTNGWSPGFYGVLVFSSSYRNEQMTFLISGNASFDYGFSKQNFSGVERILKEIEEVFIYEEEWNP